MVSKKFVGVRFNTHDYDIVTPCVAGNSTMICAKKKNELQVLVESKSVSTFCSTMAVVQSGTGQLEITKIQYDGQQV